MKYPLNKGKIDPRLKGSHCTIIKSLIAWKIKLFFLASAGQKGCN